MKTSAAPHPPPKPKSNRGGVRKPVKRPALAIYLPSLTWATAAPVTPGNLMAYRIGNGTGALLGTFNGMAPFSTGWTLFIAGLASGDQHAVVSWTQRDDDS